jgi:hypothetical protein
VNISLLFAIVTVDILALIIFVLFIIGARNCPDAPEVFGKNKISPRANIPPQNPQPNEQVVVAAPPPNPRPVYVGVDAILHAFNAETRNQVRRVKFVDYDGGDNFKAEIMMGERVHELIFKSIQDIDTIFPKMDYLIFDGMAPDNLVITDFRHRKFKKLKCISFYLYGDSIGETFSLTLKGTFDSLESIHFTNCNRMNTFVFSGENLTAIKEFSMQNCRHLVDVTGIWDGGNPLVDQNSFKNLHLEGVPLLNAANLNTWLIYHAAKCIPDSRYLTSFDCRNNGGKIKVRTDRRDFAV